jgi:transglutaminase-like putative cysteine protease
MNTSPDLQDYLSPSLCVDSDHPDVLALAQKLADPKGSALENAITLYYWVRDDIRYNPYSVSPEIDGYRASATLAAKQGWCVPKAILLAALCRAANIPARLGFADVRNHLSTEQLREMMQTDVFYYHGYTAIYLNEKWVKATPAFNVQLCDRFGLKALEFNGLEDSIYHEYDRAGNRHMEYLNDRGQHPDLPYDEMMCLFREHYPKMMQMLSQPQIEDRDATRWMAEVEAETKPQP